MKSFDNILKTIQEKKLECIFISPHLDDAFFSAGNLILSLKDTNNVKVINIFTKVGIPPYTISAKQFFKQCGYQIPSQLEKDRKQEDKFLFSKLQISTEYLDYEDALHRRKLDKISIPGTLLEEFNAIYPTYRFHIIKGKISKYDRENIEALTQELSKYILKTNTVIFCPLGIGNHVDHIILRNICTKFDTENIYWSDYPYIISNQADKKFIKDNKLTSYKYISQANKYEYFSYYKSQYKPVFGDKLPIQQDEIYYLSYDSQLIYE